LIRIFCEPGKDNIILLPPTYGMYEVCAGINNINIRKVMLSPDFNIVKENILEAVDASTKMIFICSPNNPTGNCMKQEDIEFILKNFNGIVVIDEAYIDYASMESFAGALANHPNLVLLQTLSKAWGLAALRIGMAYASEKIIGLLNKIKFPYNISLANQQLALAALHNGAEIMQQVQLTLNERKKLIKGFSRLPFVIKIFPSDANFILVKVQDPLMLYAYLSERGIIVRDRSNQPLCEGCLRITIGTAEENNLLLGFLKDYTT
jgi:histidinol-phosphate aminotransferase